MILSAGNTAPSFDMLDSKGKQVSLSDFQGKFLLLSFFRYAGCPFCNLTLIKLIERYDNFVNRGLETVVFFQSDDDSIHKYVDAKKPPFPLIADSKKVVYESYGVQSSLAGSVKSLLKVPEVGTAILRKEVSQGAMDGDKFLMPAQFVIGPDSKIIKANYGTDFMDKIPFFEIEALIVEHTMLRK